MQIQLKAIATVKNKRAEPFDDNWGDVVSEIELADDIPTEAFDGIEDFSHLEIIYFFDKVVNEPIVFSRRPRGNPAYPKVGVFAQRNKDRPNSIGLCTVELIEHQGRSIKVKYLDAINSTPILDIKPVFKEFAPKTTIKQAAWVSAIY